MAMAYGTSGKKKWKWACQETLVTFRNDHLQRHNENHAQMFIIDQQKKRRDNIKESNEEKPINQSTIPRRQCLACNPNERGKVLSV
jgi:hypothetical protein